MSSKQLHLSPQLPVSLGQKTSAASTSVVLASDYSLAVTSSDDHGSGASGANTLRVVTSTDSKIRLQDGAGNDLNSTSNALNVSVQNTTLAVTQSGTWSVRLQDGSGNSLTSTTSALDVNVKNTTLAVTQSGTWNLVDISGTISLPTGAATSAKQPALGVAGTASADVLTVQGIASMTPLKVDGSSTTQPISGTVTANQGGTWNITNISGTVSLPTGAATAAKQDTGNTSLASIVTALAGTLAVSAASLPLPTGASTAANQTTGNTSLASIDAKTPSLGQATAAASVPVVIATNQTNFPITLLDGSGNSVASLSGALYTRGYGRTKVLLYRNDNASSAISTSAYTQIVASTADDINVLYISDTSGSSFKIATGGAGVETDILYVPPGGIDPPYEIHIPASTRVSVKALDTNMSAGQLIITGLN